MRVRTAIAAAAVLAAGLTLTACQGDDTASDSKPTDPTASASASAKGGTAGSATESPGSDAGKSSASASASAGSGGGDGAVAACTSRTTKAAFVAAATHATRTRPATATVKITNISGKACTIVGATTLVAKDDQGKSGPLDADNSAAGTDAVDLAPGATATASVLYTDLNFEGTESARETCGIQASSVEIALPKDVGRAVKVTSGTGSAAVFNVCGRDLKFGAFHV
ncbi:DUF4232 domain-containing protein [Streptomyces sp. NPDC047085]|uniref:DUF4232 domain-containing protein n=1 Tax=Streptomyces sp. NPDC047085 TaxID=3155140 RepID=UPI0033C85F91